LLVAGRSTMGCASDDLQQTICASLKAVKGLRQLRFCNDGGLIGPLAGRPRRFAPGRFAA
jgi:hypothetical protein